MCAKRLHPIDPLCHPDEVADELVRIINQDDLDYAGLRHRKAMNLAVSLLYEHLVVFWMPAQFREESDPAEGGNFDDDSLDMCDKLVIVGCRNKDRYVVAELFDVDGVGWIAALHLYDSFDHALKAALEYAEYDLA